MNAVYRRLAFATVFLAVGAYGFVTLRVSLPVLLGKEVEIRNLQDENARLARENESKRERLRKLAESASERDLLIREKLKMVRPGDFEFILPHPAPKGPELHQ